MKQLWFSLAILLVFIPLTVQAQTPTPISGLKIIAERQYAVDPSAPFAEETNDVIMATARVYLLDSAEDADLTWDTLVAAKSVEKDIPANDPTIKLERIGVKDIGERATALNLVAIRDDGTKGVFRTLITQRDAMIVTVTVIAGSEDAARAADEIAAAMITRKPGPAVTFYDGAGKSSGGVWEVMLPADAPELGDLQAYTDTEIRPAQ